VQSKFTTTTTTVLRPFFRDHLGEPVPEENFQGHSFKILLTHPLPSIIYFPLQVIRLSCLGSERAHGLHVLSHVPKKYCSFINDALNHNSGLDPSLHFVGLLCCLHVFKLFLILSSCSAFGPQECQ